MELSPRMRSTVARMERAAEYQAASRRPSPLAGAAHALAYSVAAWAVLLGGAALVVWVVG